MTRSKKFKEPAAEPKEYLGSNVGTLDLPNGVKSWYMASDEYTKSAISNIEDWLNKKDNGLRLPTKTSCTFPSKWKPELDVSKELGPTDASYYQQQIGVLRWIVELGRIDVCTEVSMLAAFSANPREGHLAAVFHLFAYLKGNPKSKTVFDPTPMGHEPHAQHDWSDFCEDCKELEPHDMPGWRRNTLPAQR